MCGLVGFSGTKNADLNLIKLMLIHNSISRGTHATGLWSKESGLIKKAKPADEFLSEEATSLFKSGKTILGHVRHATVGNKDNDDFAHPFEYDNIIFQHNGSLLNHIALAKEYQINEEGYEVDSQILGRIISENFKSNTPFKGLTEYIGAAATITYHKHRETMYVTRDMERPLYYGMNNEGMYISSIAETLIIIGCTDVKSFKPYHIYEIKAGKIVKITEFHKKDQIKATLLDEAHYKAIKLIDGSTEFKLNLRPFKGAKNNISNPEIFIGHHLEAISNMYGVTKGKMYRIYDIELPRYSTGSKLLAFIGDDGKYHTLGMGCFDTENGLLYKGKEVIVLYPEGIDDSLNVGSVLTVAHYEIGDEFVYLHLDKDSIVKVPVYYVRGMSTSENEASLKGEVCTFIDNEVFYNFLLDEEGSNIEEDEEDIIEIEDNIDELDEAYKSMDNLNTLIIDNLKAVRLLSNNTTVQEGIDKSIEIIEKYKGKKVLNLV